MKSGVRRRLLLEAAERRANKAQWLCPLISLSTGAVICLLVSQIFHLANVAYANQSSSGSLMLIIPHWGEWLLFTFPLAFCTPILVYNPINNWLLGQEPPRLSVDYVIAKLGVPNWMIHVAIFGMSIMLILLGLHVRMYCRLTENSIVEQSAFRAAPTIYSYSVVRDVMMAQYFVAGRRRSGPSRYPVTFVTFDNSAQWSAHTSGLYPSMQDEERIADIVSRRSSREIRYSPEIVGFPDREAAEARLISIPMLFAGVAALIFICLLMRKRVSRWLASY